MDEYDVKRLALTLVVQAEIEGMKAANAARDTPTEAVAYDEEDFISKAEELRNIAYCHGDQL